MRVYRLPFKALTLGTAVADLWAITTGASLTCVIEEIRLDCCATAVAEYSLSLNLFTGSYTAGSGGSTLTPTPTDPADAAATFTCKTQNTTQTAVGSGTKTTKDAGSWNLVNGWAWQPLSPAHRILVPVSSCLAVSLDTASTAIVVSGCVIISEGGGV